MITNPRIGMRVHIYAQYSAFHLHAGTIVNIVGWPLPGIHVQLDNSNGVGCILHFGAFELEEYGSQGRARQEHALKFL